MKINKSNVHPVAFSQKEKFMEMLANGKPLTDIIVGINEISPTDMEILEKWKQHFKERDIPFMVARKGSALVLYKEKVV